MTEEIMALIAEIKTLCADRLDAKTAEGNVLADVFKKLESMKIKGEK